jgi:hypothetical protein
MNFVQRESQLCNKSASQVQPPVPPPGRCDPASAPALLDIAGEALYFKPQQQWYWKSPGLKKTPLHKTKMKNAISALEGVTIPDYRPAMGDLDPKRIPWGKGCAP